MFAALKTTNKKTPKNPTVPHILQQCHLQHCETVACPKTALSVVIRLEETVLYFIM